MVQVSGLLIYFPILFSMMIISLKPSLAATYYAHNCSKTTFASNSKYQTNLNTLFLDLRSNATNRYGYHNATAGVGTEDVVYGNFLCRGDQSKSSCQDCVITATITDLPITYCPNSIGAIIWYDECMVRYSNESFFGILEDNPELWWLDWESQNVTGNVMQFTDIRDDMMINIASRAAAGGSDIKYATGAVEYSSLGTVYGLVQCTPDLSNYDCKDCLVGSIATFPICKGSRLVRPSCNAWFETYSFYSGNATLTGTMPPLSGPPITSNVSGTGSGSGTGTGTVIFSPSSTPSRNSGKAKVIAIVVSLALVAAVLVAITVCFVVRRRKIQKNSEAHQTVEEDLTTRESLLYDLATLQTATNDFSKENKLGEGGYGTVYKGTLSINGEEVAVKRLSRNSRQGAQEFKNEILLVAKLHHKNLARLLGFALNEREKLLVYEYVPNKSLEHFVFDPAKQAQLDWRLRHNIILGIAKGMLYLHQDSGLKIIHRDLKASNILLDADMNPKIADFGLARMFDFDKSQSKTSRLVGTYGYMSPEYVMHGIYSTKSDVYSYGILILEIINGKINSAFPEASYGDNLVTYAWKLWREGKSVEFLDASIKDSCSSVEVTRCVHLGLLCVQEAVEKRPTMAMVVLTLESNNFTLPVPTKPGFFNKTIGNSNIGNDIMISHSSKDVSVSEIEPR